MLGTDEASDAAEQRATHARLGEPGLRGLIRSVPNSLWLVLGLWAALLLGASVLWPMSYGYDEPQHIDMAYVYSAHPFHFYGPGQLHLTQANVGMQQSVPGYPPHQLLSKAPIPPRSQRPSFSQLGGHAFISGGQPNQMVEHPPLYYWLAAVVLRIPGVSNLAWDVQVWLMRLLSVAFMLPLPALCWATTRRLLNRPGRPLGISPRLAVAAAAVPLTVPNLIRDGSSVTNDSLLILATSTVLYLLSRVVTGDLSRRTAAWVAVALAVALLTKGFALVLPPVILLAYLVGGWRTGDRLGEWVGRTWPPVLIAAIGGIVGGIWWLRNLIDYGSVQVNGFGSGYDRLIYGPPDNRGTLGHFIPTFLTDFANRIWGGVGLADTPMAGPLIVYGWLTVVLVGMAAALVCRGERRERLHPLILFTALVLTVIVVAQASFSDFERWSRAIHASQGRYSYHVMVVIACLAAVGWLRVLQPRFRPYLLPSVVVGAVITNGAVWFMLLRNWYGHGVVQAAHSLDRWSPLPFLVTWLLVVLLPALLSVAAIVVVVRESRRLRQAELVMDPMGTRSGAVDRRPQAPASSPGSHFSASRSGNPSS